MSGFEIVIHGQPGEAVQADCMIIRVEPHWYRDGALLTRQVGNLLRQASEWSAGNIGEVLHHACWTITSDPDEVRRLRGLRGHAGCLECQQGTATALAWLAEGGGHEVAIGQMWWRVHA